MIGMPLDPSVLKQCPYIECVSGKVSGAPVFKGTRLPIQSLADHLEGGNSVDEFLEWFDGVSREQVEAVCQFLESHSAKA